MVKIDELPIYQVHIPKENGNVILLHAVVLETREVSWFTFTKSLGPSAWDVRIKLLNGKIRVIRNVNFKDIVAIGFIPRGHSCLFLLKLDARKREFYPVFDTVTRQKMI